MNYRQAGRLAAAVRLQKEAGALSALARPAKFVGRVAAKAGKKLVAKSSLKDLKAKLKSLIFGGQTE